MSAFFNPRARFRRMNPFLASEFSARGDAQIYVRPHDLEVARVQNGHPGWRARVERVTPLGGFVRLELSISDQHRVHLELQSNQSPSIAFSRGDNVFLTPRHANVFDSERHTFHPVSLDQDSSAQREQIVLG